MKPYDVTAMAGETAERTDAQRRALDEMVENPRAVRKRLEAELRAEGMPEEQIKRELEFVEATLGV